MKKKIKVEIICLMKLDKDLFLKTYISLDNSFKTI